MLSMLYRRWQPAEGRLGPENHWCEPLWDATVRVSNSGDHWVSMSPLCATLNPGDPVEQENKAIMECLLGF